MTLRHRPHRLLYVPADDRPCSTLWPRLLARMVDWELVMPPAETLGWFHRPGRPEEIAAWALEQVREPLDGAVISLDMVAYGGSTASRSPNIRTALAERRVEFLAELKSAAPDVPIYAFGSIMRLYTTARSDEAARYHDALREYSELAGRASMDEEAKRRLGEVERSIPPAVLGEYLAIRGRNHQINLRAIDQVRERVVDFLVFAQDEAAVEGIHKSEQAELRSKATELGVADKVRITCGGEEIAMLLIARLIHEHMNKHPRIGAIFAVEEAADRVPPGDDMTAAQQVALAAEIAGGELSDQPEDADIRLLINGPLAGHRSDGVAEVPLAHRSEVLRQALERANELAAGRGIALCDMAYPDGTDPAFMSAILQVYDNPTSLLAYSAWQRASQSLASALAHACMRLIALQDKGAFDLAQLIANLTPMRYLALLDALIESEKAHVTLLFTRMAEDWLYQTQVRPAVSEHLVRLIRDGAMDLGEAYERAQGMVEEALTAKVADLWIEHFLGRTCVKIGMEPHRSSLVLAELEETRARLPWRRLAEVDIRVEFGVELAADE